MEQKNELRLLRVCINRTYKSYQFMISNLNTNLPTLRKNELNSLGINLKENTQYEETKMLEEITANFNSINSAIEKILNKEGEIFTIKREYDNLKHSHDELTTRYRNSTEEIKKMKMKILGLENKASTTVNNLSKLFTGLGNKSSAHALFESLLVLVKSLKISHICEMNLKDIKGSEELKKTKTKEFQSEIEKLKKSYESEFSICIERSKRFITIEEIESILEEYKVFTQGILDYLLNTLMSYKMDMQDEVAFKMSINNFNSMLEKIAENMEVHSRKLDDTIESFKLGSENVTHALELLNNQSTVNVEFITSCLER